jgi:uncharacterized membrane protein
MFNVAQVMPTVLASFMASLVEFVEALTVVLAVGSVRGWKSALSGTVTALLTLVMLIFFFGRSLRLVPIFMLQVGIGLLLLLFGLRWLRKAILRSAGAIPLHDEDRAFEKETEKLRASAPASVSWDPVAFASTYKIVMLEGIEVVFIVVALGSRGSLIVPAAIGAAAALGSVVLLGLAIHRPLSRVPENTLKFAVAILLSAFGTFWVGEGIGVAWPAQDWSLLALCFTYLVTGRLLVVLFRRLSPAGTVTTHSILPRSRRNLVTRIYRELVAMFVDDAWLASGTVAWVALCAIVAPALPIAAAIGAVIFTAGITVILYISSARGARDTRSA